jgi:hypothetical protein
MQPLLLVIPALLLLQTPGPSGPDPVRIKKLHDQISFKALDPQTLTTLGQGVTGCRPDEEGETKNDFRTAARAVGTTVNPRLQSPVSDANPIPPAERPPRYFPPASRLAADSFVYVDQAGTERKVAALKGKVVVVFLFKPDCKYTSDMMGEILRLHGLQKGKPYEVVPVSIGSEGWGGLARWRQQNMNILSNDFPIHRPGIQPGTGVSIFGELLGTPTTLILDQHGRVAWRFNGAMRGALADRLSHIMLEGLLETLPAAGSTQ